MRGMQRQLDGGDRARADRGKQGAKGGGGGASRHARRSGGFPARRAPREEDRRRAMAAGDAAPLLGEPCPPPRSSSLPSPPSAPRSPRSSPAHTSGAPRGATPGPGPRAPAALPLALRSGGGAPGEGRPPSSAPRANPPAPPDSGAARGEAATRLAVLRPGKPPSPAAPPEPGTLGHRPAARLLGRSNGSARGAPTAGPGCSSTMGLSGSSGSSAGLPFLAGEGSLHGGESSPPSKPAAGVSGSESSPCTPRPDVAAAAGRRARCHSCGARAHARCSQEGVREQRGEGSAGGWLGVVGGGPGVLAGRRGQGGGAWAGEEQHARAGLAAAREAWGQGSCVGSAANPVPQRRAGPLSTSCYIAWDAGRAAQQPLPPEAGVVTMRRMYWSNVSPLYGSGEGPPPCSEGEADSASASLSTGMSSYLRSGPQALRSRGSRCCGHRVQRGCQPRTWAGVRQRTHPKLVSGSIVPKSVAGEGRSRPDELPPAAGLAAGPSNAGCPAVRSFRCAGGCTTAASAGGEGKAPV
jgi:hypothetical protein